MTVHIQKVSGVNRKSIPETDESILEIFNIEFIDIIESLIVSFRPNECWIIDFTFIDGSPRYIKLPVEMTEEQVEHYMQPLASKLNIIYKNKVE